MYAGRRMTVQAALSFIRERTARAAAMFEINLALNQVTCQPTQMVDPEQFMPSSIDSTPPLSSIVVNCFSHLKTCLHGPLITTARDAQEPR